MVYITTWYDWRSIFELLFFTNQKYQHKQLKNTERTGVFHALGIRLQFWLVQWIVCLCFDWSAKKNTCIFFSGAWRWLNFVALSCDWFVAFQVDIPVRIVGGETVLVTFTGVGYDQRIMGDTLPVRDMGSTTVPDKQVVQVPKQVCVSVTVFKALYPLQQ